MALEILQDDDATAVTDLPITGLEAGADSDTIALHVWNELGNPGGQARKNVRLLLEVEDRDSPGTFVASGWPPVDELWGRVRIVGQDNASDPTFLPPASDWQPVGAYGSFLLGDVPADCAIYCELKMRPPGSAAELAWRFALALAADDASEPLAGGRSVADRGILPGLGDYGYSALLEGGALTATGTPDDEVHVAPTFWARAGLAYGKITTDHTLNQSDGAAAALASGESYIALLTLGAGTVTVTKGAKGASPALPARPAGEPLLGVVTVRYQAGGTSVVDPSDVDTTGVVRGRYALEAGSGAQVLVHPGEAVGGGTHRFQSGVRPVALTLSATNYLYQVATGNWQAETTEAAPETTALGPWAEIDCDGSGVTEIRDRRGYAGRRVVLLLKGAPPGSPGTVDEAVVEHERLAIEEIVLVASNNGGGASGATRGDLLVNGSTVFASHATEDLRPAIDFDATELRVVAPYAEVRDLRRGDILTFATAAHPTGGTPDRLMLAVVCAVV